MEVSAHTIDDEFGEAFVSWHPGLPHIRTLHITGNVPVLEDPQVMQRIGNLISVIPKHSLRGFE